MLESLLAALAADPADDLGREAAADWLEENGRAERAELIRVQLALDPHPLALQRRWWEIENARGLRRRELDLLARFREEWIKEEHGESAASSSVRVTRGFADMFTAETEADVPVVRSAAGRRPIRHLKLRSLHGAESYHALFRWADRLTAPCASVIAAADGESKTGKAFLARSCGLATFDPRVLDLLADGTLMPRLERVDMARPGSWPGDGVESFRRVMRRLTVATIRTDVVTSDLLRSDLSRIEEIWLEASNAASLVHVLEMLPNLRVLVIDGEGELGEGSTMPIQVLQRIARLEKLSHLHVRGAELTADGAGVLREAPRFPKLLALGFAPAIRQEARTLGALFGGLDRTLALSSLKIWSPIVPGNMRRELQLSAGASECLQANASALGRLRSLLIEGRIEPSVAFAEMLPELVELLVGSSDRIATIRRTLAASKNLPERLVELQALGHEEKLRTLQKQFPQTLLQ